MRRKNGFTVIEVMIVLAVSGLLLTTVLLANKQLKQSERNAKRKNIVHAFAAALEEYYINNNCYPQTVGGYSNNRAPLVDMNSASRPIHGCANSSSWDLSGFLPPAYNNNSTASNYKDNGMNDPNGNYEYGRLCYASMSKDKYVLYYIPEPMPHTGGNCGGHTLSPGGCTNNCTEATLPPGAVQVKI